MDDAVLIEGKIRYLKGDLDSAIQLLSYLVDYYPKGYIAGHLPGGKLKRFDDMVRQAVRKRSQSISLSLNTNLHEMKVSFG